MIRSVLSNESIIMKTNKAYIPFISRKVLQRQTRKVLQPLNGISLGLGLLLTAGVAPVVSAITLDINPEIEADWTNTLKYSLGARTGSKNKTNLNNSNADDSERNFDRGSLVMNRVDWLSELNFKYQNYSLNLSGAGWYDNVYNSSNENDSPSTANAFTASNDHYTSDARKWAGRDFELMNAFVGAQYDAFGYPISVRLGRHTLLWGRACSSPITALHPQWLRWMFTKR
ncbi:DUF1302 family protein [Pseudomonas poae]|nr:DUF1302 family protein [Pseudomonas poae]